jgi:hypothetical protein
MPGLPDVRLLTPEFPNWDAEKEVAEAGPVERGVVRLLARLRDMSEQMQGAQASPESIAWLHIWSRLFRTLHDGYAAWESQSAFTLELLSRAAFEVFLHTSIIFKPFLERTEPAGSAMAQAFRAAGYWSEDLIRDRLRGYTTWVLWGDRELCQSVLHPAQLHNVFDPEPGRKVVAELGPFGPLGPDWGEEVETLTDGEARAARQHTERLWRDRLKRTEAWLADPRLSDWTVRLRKLSSEPGGRTITLYRLFDEDERSIPDALRGLGIRWAYTPFQRASSQVHGSTLEGFLVLGEDFIAPNVLNVRQEADDNLGEITSFCDWPVFALQLLAADFREHE